MQDEWMLLILKVFNSYNAFFHQAKHEFVLKVCKMDDLKF